MSPSGPRALRLGAALLAFAAAALAFGGGAPPVVRVVLEDVSRSVASRIPPALPAAGDPPAEVIRFGGDATDLGAALSSALARIPPGAAGEILLATDGRATEGDAAPALAEARRRGVTVRTFPLGTAGLPARAAAVEAPAAVRPGDRFPVAVLVTGSPGEGMEVVLEDVAAGESERRAVLVPAGGRARVVFARVAPAPGVRRYRAGRAEAAVLVEGEAAVLRVGREPAGPAMAAILRRLGGGAFREGGLDGADLEGLAGVVLDDVPESDLPAGLGERLRAAVEGGLGLVVVGGPRTLGPGGFAGRPVEEPLPVRCAPDRPKPLLVLAVDVSGSMDASAPAARAAAADLVGRLPADGRLALLFFHDALAAAAGPFDLADLAARAEAGIEAARVRAPGGGTRFGAAAEGALAAAARSPGGGARRLLVVTDGRPAEDEAGLARVAKSLADARFTVKVVAVGEDPDLPRLRAFAGEDGVLRAGSGDLAGILGSVSGNGDPALFEGTPASVRAGPDAPPFGAVPAGLPPVAGFDRVFARKEARVWLALEGGEPLLAARQAGLGRSVVFAAAPAAGSGEWAAPPAAAVLEAAFRWALRAPGGEGSEARALLRPDGAVDLLLETPPGGAPSGEVRAGGAALRRTGPSRWEGRIPRGPEEVVAFEAGGGLIARAAVAPAPSDEDLLLGPDEAALEALEVPGRSPSGRPSGAGPGAVMAGLAALALLLTAAAGEARSRPRGPSV